MQQFHSAAAHGLTTKRRSLDTFPIKLLPALCRKVQDAGKAGKEKVAKAFALEYEEVNIAQTLQKIPEIAEKVKKTGDTQFVWYIRTEFMDYLNE